MEEQERERKRERKASRYLFYEVCVPFAQLPVLSGKFLRGRLQLADVNLQLFGIVPGDLHLPFRLLGLGARVLTSNSQRIIFNLESSAVEATKLVGKNKYTFMTCSKAKARPSIMGF